MAATIQHITTYHEYASLRVHRVSVLPTSCGRGAPIVFACGYAGMLMDGLDKVPFYRYQSSSSHRVRPSKRAPLSLARMEPCSIP